MIMDDMNDMVYDILSHQHLTIITPSFQMISLHHFQQRPVVAMGQIYQGDKSDLDKSCSIYGKEAKAAENNGYELGVK